MNRPSNQNLYHHQRHPSSSPSCINTQDHRYNPHNNDPSAVVAVSKVSTTSTTLLDNSVRVLPTKVVRSGCGGEKSTGAAAVRQHTTTSSTTTHERRWVAKPILEWLEELALVAAAESDDDDDGATTRNDGQYYERQQQQYPYSETDTTCAVDHSDSFRWLCAPTLVPATLPAFPVAAEWLQKPLCVDRVSRRVFSDDEQQPKHWDLSILFQYDPHSVQQHYHSTAKQMLFLAHQLEKDYLIIIQRDSRSSSNNEDSSVSDEQEAKLDSAWMAYRTIQSRFQYKFESILAQQQQQEYDENMDCRHSQDALRTLLDALYQESANALRELLLRFTTSKKDTTDRVPTKISVSETSENLKTCVEHDTIIPFSPSLSSSPTNSTSSTGDDSATAYKRGGGTTRDLATFMTKWLRDNWINPYPDEATLSELAEECGSSVVVVGNWLINARTRKWRPAIIKASKLAHRPSHCLLHDSIHIFDGHDISDLQNLSDDGTTKTDNNKLPPTDDEHQVDESSSTCKTVDDNHHWNVCNESVHSSNRGFSSNKRQKL